MIAVSEGQNDLSDSFILGCRHIPDVRARTSRLFLALNKRGDFKIWSDEFEELCDVIAKEVERQPELTRLKRRRSNTDMHFVKHPFYAYVIWAFTLSSLSIAIAALNVCISQLCFLLIVKTHFVIGSTYNSNIMEVLLLSFSH